MTKYVFKAIDSAKSVHTGTFDAHNKSDVINMLGNKGWRALSISEEGARKKGDIPLPSFLQKKAMKSEQLVIFTRQLSAMVSAGVPLLRALGSLEGHSEDATEKKIIGELYRDVQSGMSIGDALAKHPDTFNDVYVNMVRAGEAAGILDDILKRLAMQQEKSATMKKKIKSAMTYPMVLVGITVVAFFGLMIFVIPQIGKIIKDLGGPDSKLPALTEAMLGISSAITNYWFIVLPIVAGLIYAIMHYIKTPKGKRQFHALILKLPGISTIVQKVAVARFARIFSALMGAGVAVLDALDVTAHALGNKIYEEALLGAIDDVKNGATLSSVIEKTPLFPPIVSQMLSVGEETGQTDQVLVKVADFYEEEVDTAIDGMSAIIEPFMIVFMGGMVGLIAASVMMPIAGLSNQIKG
ncbi:MAG TPA: type II secretion system F family protein [Patescibacteria group bacterium]|jgi:type IV pilus assembly protein PilC|nr:type II secretion system F family protein [Patescibacteria group bacterium]